MTTTPLQIGDPQCPNVLAFNAEPRRTVQGARHTNFLPPVVKRTAVANKRWVGGLKNRARGVQAGVYPATCATRQISQPTTSSPSARAVWTGHYVSAAGRATQGGATKTQPRPQPERHPQHIPRSNPPPAQPRHGRGHVGDRAKNQPHRLPMPLFCVAPESLPLGFGGRVFFLPGMSFPSRGES